MAPASVTPVPAHDTLSWRTRQRLAAVTQIVKDSIHGRPGWATCYLLEWRQRAVGFASVAHAGPWTGKPTAFECHVDPDHAHRVLELFEAFLDRARPAFLELQSNLPHASLLLHAFGRNPVPEAIVFADHHDPNLPESGTTLRALTPPDALASAIERRQGSADWSLDLDGESVATGSLLFHYNRPFADIAMEVRESHRRRGLGAMMVRALKRTAYQLGAVPAARCNPSNVASQRTLLRAGFQPVGHIVVAEAQGRSTLAGIS